MRQSFSYNILFWLVRVGLKIYLSKRETYGNTGQPRPAIYTSNHQNALMDVLVIVTEVWDRQLSFIARSDIFKRKNVSRFLRSINMLPIFRLRDKVNIVEKNKDTFAEVIRRLEAGGTVKIFPEGNHDIPRRIRPLKKGFARMAFEMAEKTDFETDLYIVPIGTYYESPQKTGTDVLVQYGEAIPVNKYETLYKSNKAKAIRTLTHDLREALKPLVIHIESEKYYETIEMLRKILRKKIQAEHEFTETSLLRNFKSDQYIIAQCEHEIQEDEASFKVYSNEVLEYKKGIEQYNLNDELLNKNKYAFGEILLKIILGIITFPIYFYAIINSILPYWILKKRFLNRVKDPVFHATVKFAVGLFLFPLMWVLQSVALMYYFGIWVALTYVFTMPLFLKLAIWWQRYWQITKAQYRYNYLSSKPEVQQLKKMRTNIINNFL